MAICIIIKYFYQAYITMNILIYVYIFFSLDICSLNRIHESFFHSIYIWHQLSILDVVIEAHLVQQMSASTDDHHVPVKFQEHSRQCTY